MQALEWHEEARDRDPQWTVAVRELEVTLTRIPAVASAKLRTWSGQLTAEQCAGLDAFITHVGAWQMPNPSYVPGWGGTLALADSGRGHDVVFTSTAAESCPPEDWLRFPAGAASDVVAMFAALRSAVYGPPSTLPSWHPPACEGPAAGALSGPEQRVVLSYAWSEPNPIDSRRRFQQKRWFASGRVVSETLWVDDRTQETSVTPIGEKRIDPDVVAAACEELRKLRFFSGGGSSTGSRYDGEERVVCHHLGARLEKMLSYEVEMGARCGLSAAENAGLDRVRELERLSRSG